MCVRRSTPPRRPGGRRGRRARSARATPSAGGPWGGCRRTGPRATSGVPRPAVWRRSRRRRAPASSRYASSTARAGVSAPTCQPPSPDGRSTVSPATTARNQKRSTSSVRWLTSPRHDQPLGSTGRRRSASPRPSRVPSTCARWERSAARSAALSSSVAIVSPSRVGVVGQARAVAVPHVVPVSSRYASRYRSRVRSTTSSGRAGGACPEARSQPDAAEVSQSRTNCLS